jgi:hypothetical protein
MTVDMNPLELIPPGGVPSPHSLWRGPDARPPRKRPRRSRRTPRSWSCLPSRRCRSDPRNEHEVVSGEASGADRAQVVARLAERDVPVRVVGVIPGRREVLAVLAVLKHLPILSGPLDGFELRSADGGCTRHVAAARALSCSTSSTHSPTLGRCSHDGSTGRPQRSHSTPRSAGSLEGPPEGPDKGSRKARPCRGLTHRPLSTTAVLVDKPLTTSAL